MPLDDDITTALRTRAEERAPAPPPLAAIRAAGPVPLPHRPPHRPGRRVLAVAAALLVVVAVAVAVVTAGDDSPDLVRAAAAAPVAPGTEVTTPGGWPDCRDGDRDAARWPATEVLTYRPAVDEDPADMSGRVADLAASLVPALPAAVIRRGATPGCTLVYGGDEGMTLEVLGSRADGYTLKGVGYPNGLAPHAVSVRLGGEHIRMDVERGWCGDASACEITVAARYGDDESTASAPSRAAEITVPLARDRSASLALVRTATGESGTLLSAVALAIPPLP